MSVQSVFKSFKHALKGIAYTFDHERNFRIQLYVSVGVIFLMVLFPLKTYEVIVLLLLITMVLMLEMLNSVIEKFLDILKPRLHFHVKVVKDMMAGIVLLSAVLSIVIGLIIFLPYIVEMSVF